MGSNPTPSANFGFGVRPGLLAHAVSGFTLPITFGPDGRFLRSSRLDSEAGGALPTVLLPDRALLARPGFSFNSSTPGGSARDTAALPRFDLDGGRVGEVDPVPMGENWVFSIGGLARRGGAPFGEEKALGPAGRGVLVAAGGAPGGGARPPRGGPRRGGRPGRRPQGGAALAADGWRTVHRARAEGRLATAGVYAKGRHPQYTGLFLIVFGEGPVHWRTIGTVLAFPIIVAAYALLARKEERQMLEKFDDAYREYRRRVPMFIPRSADRRVQEA